MTIQEEHIKLFEVLVTKLQGESYYVNVDYSEEMPSGFVRRLRDNVSSQISIRLYSGNSCKLIVTKEQRIDSILPDRLANHHVVHDAIGTQEKKYILNLSSVTLEDVVDWFNTYFYN